MDHLQLVGRDDLHGRERTGDGAARQLLKTARTGAAVMLAATAARLARSRFLSG
jgi:hypothetical protein